MPIASKYIIEPGKKYGNMTAIEYVKIMTKSGNMEWRWRCEDDEGNTYHMRTRALYVKGLKDETTDVMSKEEMDKYFEDLEKGHMNQMGLRKKYYQEYVSNAFKRGFPFNITFDEFNELISQPCYYCGQEPYVHKSMLKRANMNEPMLKCVGIDRIDSSNYYYLDNCVPCCTRCNLMKNTLSRDEFLSHVHKIEQFQSKIKESSTTIPEGSTSQANGDGSGMPQED